MNTNQKWIVRDSRGRIFGPFATDKLKHLISRSVFTGEEFIASYPDGQFVEITKVPEFYDLLLEVLSKESRALSEDQRRVELTINQEERSSQKQNSQENPTPSSPVVNRAVREKKLKNLKPKKTEEFSDSETFVGEKKPKKASHDTIELKQKDEEKNKKPLFLIIFLAPLIGILIYLFYDNSNQETSTPTGQIELAYPHVKRSPIGEQQGKEKLAQAVRLFQKDTFYNYYQAMNILVELIESGYPNVETISLLCLTQRELWQYAKQDSQDLMAVAKMAQLASQRDPVGLVGATCRLTQLVLGGQFDVAAGLVDSILNDNPSAPAFYDFKASFLASKGDYASAEAYENKGRILWPKWLKFAQKEAEYMFEQEKYNESANLYREVLKENPNHATAKINLGLIEYYKFKHAKLGAELIKTALEQERVPRAIASKGYVLLSLESERSGDQKTAIDLANKAYSYDPTNGSARAILQQLGGEQGSVTKAADRELVALGEEYMKKKNYFAAQAEFKSAFELNPKNGRAAMLAGQSLWELNQSIEAIDWLKKSVSADKNLIQAYIQLADYYSQRYDFKSAGQVLSNAQRISPSSYQVLSGFALVELRRNNFKVAAETAKKALKLYDTDIDTHVILSQALLSLGDEKGAFEIISRALSLDKNNQKTQIAYAEVLAKYQGVDAAVEYLKNIINTYPQYIDYRIALAKILITDDRMDQASEALKFAIGISEHNKESHILLARVYQKKGLHREALKEYLTAAALDPSDAYPLYLAGLLYIDMNNFTKASEQFERVIRVNPLFPKAHYYMGFTALLMGQFDKALKEAEIEKKMNPRLSDGYVLAGNVYMKRRDYIKATREYQKAVSLLPTANLYILLSRAYRLSGNLSVADSLLSRAIKLEDGNPEIYKERGAIEEGRGEISQAVVAYQKYLELLPNAPDRTEIEQRIKKIGGQ